MAPLANMHACADDGVIAEWLGRQLGAALIEGEAPIAVTFPGGTTPFPILAKLIGRGLDWSRVSVWPNDDRLVPEDHPASNTGRLRRLLGPLGAEVVTLSEMEQVPRFALTWLGLGADGHTASLFPSSNPQADDLLRVRRLIPDPLPPEAPFPRITLTIPSLIDTAAIVIVARGTEKRAVLERALRHEGDSPIARLLAAARAPVTCFT